MRSNALRDIWPAIVLALFTCTAEARAVGAHLEVGIGPSIARPLERESAFGASAFAGLSARVARTLRIGVDFAATAGGDFPGTSYIPEASTPGDRSLKSAVLAIEMSRGQTGPFIAAGVGAGHATLKNARGVFEPPYGDRWIIPSRSLTAFAIGAGMGYRFGWGPGPFGLQLGLRTHALVNAGHIPASAWAVTIGLAY